MRTMYDAVTASNIPTLAQVVAGYDDGQGLWPPGAWARFPNAVKVHISSLGTNTGHVLDCEPGNPNAAQSVNWVLMRRAAGVDPYVYTAEWAPGYRWVDVCAAHDARGVARPHWWKAPGHPGDLGGAGEPLMVQCNYPGPFDVGVAADYLPGIDGAVPPPPPPPPPITEDDMSREVTAVRPDGGADLFELFPDGSVRCYNLTANPPTSAAAKFDGFNDLPGVWYSLLRAGYTASGSYLDGVGQDKRVYEVAWDNGAKGWTDPAIIDGR